MTVLLVPPFPLMTPPDELDALTAMAATIFLEAEGESDPGKLAVGWVIRWRSERWARTIRQAIFGPDGLAYDDGRPYEPFSCWNDDYRARANARLASAEGPAVEASWRAAAAALWALLPDPTGGGDHYLNIPLTRRIRGGTLPAWFDEAKVTATIGAHTFLRLAA